jgi:importin subunit alpha-1
MALQILAAADSTDLKYLKLEAAWILTNIAYGSEEVLRSLLTPQFIAVINNLLNSPTLDLVLLDQIMFLMGNISGTKAVRPDVLRHFDLVSVINRVIQNHQQIGKCFAKNYVWVASNLSEDAKALELQQIKGLAKIFHEFIECFNQRGSDNEEVLVDIVKGLSELAATDSSMALDWVSGVSFDKNGVIIATMVDLLSSKNEQLYQKALPFVGGILNSDNEVISQKCMLSGVVDKLTNLLYSANGRVIKETLWAFSNYCANGAAYSDQVLRSSAFYRCIVLTSSPNLDVREEAFYALTNALTCCKLEALREAFLANFNEAGHEHGQVIFALLQGLKVKTSRLVGHVLEALQRLLDSDQELKLQGHSTSVYHKMRDYEAPRYLESLTTHQSELVHSRATAIWELFHAYDQEFGDNDMEIADANEQHQAQPSTQYNGMQFTI